MDIKTIITLITSLFRKSGSNPAPTPTPSPVPMQKPRSTVVIDKTGSRAWGGVVLHHSTSKDGVTRDTEAIIKYHTSYRVDYTPVTKEEYERRKAAGQGHKFEEPWSAVGYHFLIEQINGVLTVNFGRSLTVRGAHAGHPKSNMYNDYIGVCVIGNFDVDKPSKEVIEFTQAFIRTLQDTFGFTNEVILGHRETYDKLGVPREKQCPGTNWDMEVFRGGL